MAEPPGQALVPETSYLIVTVPGASAVTKPDASMVAMEVLEEVQVPPGVAPVLENCIVFPTQMSCTAVRTPGLMEDDTLILMLALDVHPPVLPVTV